jgi:hypothetical protein
MAIERVLAAVGMFALLAMLVGRCAAQYPRPWYVKAARTGGAIVTLFSFVTIAFLLTLAWIR